MPPVHYHFGQFPPKSLDWPRLIPLIGPANAGLARYDGLLAAIPNAQVLLSPLTTQEAVLSSKEEADRQSPVTCLQCIATIIFIISQRQARTFRAVARWLAAPRSNRGQALPPTGPVF